MARKTYRIELKIDFDDDARHVALLEVAKEMARNFVSSAMLLADNRKPQIALITDDAFIGQDEINIIPTDEVIA